MPTLVSIAYSPWSLRVKDALDRMGTAYRLRSYTPTLSEPRLRWDLRRPLGRVTVPVLLREDGPPLDHGLDIVRWAAARSDRPLITPDDDAAVARWSEAADRLLEAGRVRTTRRVLDSPEALRESLPGPVRRLGPVGMAIGRDAARRLLRKYGDGRDDEAHLATMRATLEELAAAVADGEHVLAGPSYADLCVAYALAFVRPHARHKLGPRSRACWTEPELVADFEPLLAWRDRVLGG